MVGGALIGAGMSLTGACPGTVLVQVGHGIPSSLPTALGTLSGGLVYAKYGKLWIARKSRSQDDVQPDPQTIASKLGVNQTAVFLAFEILAVATVALSNILLPGRTLALIPTLGGGILIGVAQAVSVILTSNSLGVSMAYEHIGSHIWQSLGLKTSTSGSPRLSRSVLFALGVISSSFFLAITIASSYPARDISISFGRALIGGFMLSYGARVAGGCTSGHGLSGLSMLSYSSLVTVTAMFGTGITVARLLG